MEMDIRLASSDLRCSEESLIELKNQQQSTYPKKDRSRKKLSAME